MPNEFKTWTQEKDKRNGPASPISLSSGYGGIIEIAGMDLVIILLPNHSHPIIFEINNARYKDIKKNGGIVKNQDLGSILGSSVATLALGQYVLHKGWAVQLIKKRGL